MIGNGGPKSDAPTIAQFDIGGPPLSFIMTLQIEAPCYAGRILFRQPFNTATTIVGASVTPTSSYGDMAPPSFLLGSDRRSYAPVTGGAPTTRIYFDNRGAAGTPTADAINLGGLRAGTTIPANTANPANAAVPWTFYASDFGPMTAIPRVDGGPGYLVCMLVTIDGTGVAIESGINFDAFNRDPSNRARFVCAGIWSNGGADCSQDPQCGSGGLPNGRSGWGSCPYSPILGFQYYTDRPGIQIAMTGDSLTAAPSSDSYSNALLRASWDLSSSYGISIEVCNLAWGGGTAQQYNPVLLNNAPIVKPSIVSLQPLSRNNGGTTAQMQMLYANALAMAQHFSTAFGAKALMFSPGCQPGFDPVNGGSAEHIAAFTDVRARMIAADAVSGMVYVDGPSVIGQTSSPWLYIPGVSDDNTHPNSAGSEAVVPLARKALQLLIGAD